MLVTAHETGFPFCQWRLSYWRELRGWIEGVSSTCGICYTYDKNQQQYVHEGKDTVHLHD